ncbi:MAG TPA: TIM44-like domain-containing protein, partial [Kofleriaceae bacterium]|nr:TIM44-like domain-containing protein [Kofleriaceae bacterium]
MSWPPRRAALLLGLFVVGALAGVAAARPGGGQSYSGGGHSYSGGGGYSSGHSYSGGSYSSSNSGGGSLSAGAALGILFGFAIMIVIIAVVQGAQSNAYTSALTAPTPPPRLDLQPLLSRDPDFSRVAFEDFAYRLYSESQRARHARDELIKLAPYLGAGAFDGLLRRASRVEQVVIGNLRIIQVGAELAGTRTKVVVAIEANLAGPSGTTNALERWTFLRAPNVTTRPPERTRTFACPNCNAPFASGETWRTCAHCGTDIETGKFDWTVDAIAVDAETSVGQTLTGTVEEVGNDFPTLIEPEAQERLMQLRQDDTAVTWDAFTARVAMIYARLNSAWNAQELAPVRGLVTASLLQYLQYWIDEYKRQTFANKLEEARISHIALAKVTRDKWFDAITVRVYADGLDFTVDKEQRVVGGSRSNRRAYTEYWTFIRSSARRGPVTVDPKCPNCGAPLAISNAGVCTHCN